MPDPRTNEVSVYRITGLTPEKVWRLGNRRITRPFHGIGEITMRHIVKHKLDVVPTKIPPRHANIVGWPPESEKARQKSLAQQLAAASTLQLRVPIR